MTMQKSERLLNQKIKESWVGTSSETKPRSKSLAEGSTFYEHDTQDLYMYNGEFNDPNAWVKQ